MGELGPMGFKLRVGDVVVGKEGPEEENDPRDLGLLRHRERKELADVVHRIRCERWPRRGHRASDESGRCVDRVPRTLR